MKLLFFLLMIPSYIIFPIILTAGGFVYLDEVYLRPVSGGHDLSSNLYMAFLHLSLSLGLLLSALNFLYVSCMMLLALIIKSYYRVAITLFSAGISLAVAIYLLNRDL